MKNLTSRKPTYLEYKELRPFNPAWPKRLKLYTKIKGGYLIPRTLILPKERTDIQKLPDFLRPQQKKAIEELVKFRYGLLLSGVGSGKSFMMAAMAQVYKGNTLVIAPKTEIAKGLYDKFTELGIEVEVFNSKKFNGKNTNYPKVLIMVSKSVNLYWEKLNLDRIYKQVLIDEIHMEFTSNRIELFCKYDYDYIYGFTGTPELNNFSSEALYQLFNNIAVDSGIWPKDPEVFLHLYNGGEYGAADWQDLVEQMYWDKNRLAEFTSMVVEVMKRPDRNMGIIFVDRKDIAEGLAEMISRMGVEAQAYTGKLSSKKRQEVLLHLTRVKGIMVATDQTVGTGFDHPPLDTAFYFMFVKFKAQVKQALGRILRGADNPEYYDFQDANLYNQRRERIQAYKEMWNGKQFKNYVLKNEALYLQSLALYEELLKHKTEKKLDFLDF